MFLDVNKLLVAFMTTSLIACSNAMAAITVPELPQFTHSKWESQYLSGVDAFERRNYEEAEKAFKSALFSAGSEASKRMLTLDALDELYEEQQNYAAEEDVLLQCIDLIRSSSNGGSGALLGVTYLKLASVSSSLNHLEQSERYELLALPILKESQGPESPDVAVALNNLAWVEYKLNKFELSEKYFRKSLYVLKRNFGDKHVLYGLTANNLAELYELMGDKGKAYFWYGMAAAAFKASLGGKDILSQEAYGHCRQLKPFVLHSKKRCTKK